MPSFLELLKGCALSPNATSKGGASDDPVLRARPAKMAPNRPEGRRATPARTKEPTKILLTDIEPSSAGLLAELMGTRAEHETAGDPRGVSPADPDKPHWMTAPPAKGAHIGALLVHARTLLSEGEGEWSDGELPGSIKKAVERAARLVPPELRIGPREIAEATAELSELLLGFGPLKELVIDPHITDICVDSHDRISCIRLGRAIETPFTFRSREDFRGFVGRIIRLIGRNVSLNEPIVEGVVQLSSQLDSRVRIQCVHGSVRGSEDPALVMRVQRFPFVSLYDLLKAQMLPAPVAAVLSEVITFRESTVLIVGPPCSGKTTLARALLGAVGSDERIALVEHVPEVQLSSCQVERFIPRPTHAGHDARGQHDDIARYIGHAAVHRAVFGEIRCGDAALVLGVLESGRRGAIATLSAASSEAALESLSHWLAQQAGGSRDVARSRWHNQIDLVLVTRLENGRPCLVEVAEVIGGEHEEIVSIVRYEGEGKGKRFWRMTGVDTPLMARLAERGVELLTSPQCLPPLSVDTDAEEGDGAR